MNALALLVGLVPLVALEPPPPTEPEASENAKNATATKHAETDAEHGTASPDGAALIQNNSNPRDGPQRREGADEQDQSSQGNAVSIWGHPAWSVGTAVVTVLATIVIAFAAVRQWLTAKRQARYMALQSRSMHRGLIQTRKAADAARKSADVAECAMKTSERPFILIDPVTLVDFFPGKAAHIDFPIRNGGKTPAFFTDGKIRLKTHRNELASPPDYGEAHEDPDKSVANIWLNPGQKMGNEVGWATPIDADVYWWIVNGEMKLTIFGYVTFRDAFKVSRTLGFGLRYVPQKKGGSFRYVSLPGYNYERENHVPNPPAPD